MSECRAAIVAAVDGDQASLVVLNPTGLFFNPCKHDEGQAAGTWHWPERD